MELTVALLWVTSILLVGFVMTPLRFFILKRDADRIFAMQMETKARRQAETTSHVKDQLQGSLVFLGDSLTEEYALEEYFPQKLVVNRGISGDTSRGVLNRVQESVVDLQPAVVILHVGTNDVAVGRSDEHILTDIEKIIDCLVTEVPGLRIYLNGLYPINKTDFTDLYSRVITMGRSNQRLEALNGKLAALAQGKNLPFLSFGEALKDHKGELRKDYSVEGLHLSAKAYRRITELLKEAIEDLR